MPDFLVDFFTRYGLDIQDVLYNAAWVLGAVQVIKQFTDVITGYWTLIVALLVATAVAFMAYGPLGVWAVAIAAITMTIVSVIGKGWINQFVPGKSIKDKRNGTNI